MPLTVEQRAYWAATLETIDPNLRGLYLYQRRALARRDNWRCGLCGEVITSEADLSADHIVPWRMGGRSTPDNLRAAHRLCNTKRRQPFVCRTCGTLTEGGHGASRYCSPQCRVKSWRAAKKPTPAPPATPPVSEAD